MPTTQGEELELDAADDATVGIAEHPATMATSITIAMSTNS
jgi:hypothetical protein